MGFNLSALCPNSHNYLDDSGVLTKWKTESEFLFLHNINDIHLPLDDFNNFSAHQSQFFVKINRIQIFLKWILSFL